MRSIDKFISTLLSYESRKAILEGEKMHTYSELVGCINKYGNLLNEFKIKSGEIVFLLGDYSLESISLFFSLANNNNIIVPVTSENTEEL